MPELTKEQLALMSKYDEFLYLVYTMQEVLQDIKGRVEQAMENFIDGAYTDVPTPTYEQLKLMLMTDAEDTGIPVGDVTPETFPDLVSTDPPVSIYVVEDDDSNFVEYDDGSS